MSKTKDKMDKKRQVDAPKNEEKNYFYPDEKVKNFSYSDFIKVNASSKGMLLSFGKAHPESDKFAIINEVYVPLDVIYNLKQIIEAQFERLVKEGAIELQEKPDAPTE